MSYAGSGQIVRLLKVEMQRLTERTPDQRPRHGWRPTDFAERRDFESGAVVGGRPAFGGC